MSWSAFAEADRNDAVRAVIVTGAGKVFCAGMEMQPEEGGNVFGYDEAEGMDPPWSRFVIPVAKCPWPSTTVASR